MTEIGDSLMEHEVVHLYDILAVMEISFNDKLNSLKNNVNRRINNLNREFKNFQAHQEATLERLTKLEEKSQFIFDMNEKLVKIHEMFNVLQLKLDKSGDENKRRLRKIDQLLANCEKNVEQEHQTWDHHEGADHFKTENVVQKYEQNSYQLNTNNKQLETVVFQFRDNCDAMDCDTDEHQSKVNKLNDSFTGLTIIHISIVLNCIFSYLSTVTRENLNITDKDPVQTIVNFVRVHKMTCKAFRIANQAISLTMLLVTSKALLTTVSRARCIFLGKNLLSYGNIQFLAFNFGLLIITIWMASKVTIQWKKSLSHLMAITVDMEREKLISTKKATKVRNKIEMYATYAQLDNPSFSVAGLKEITPHLVIDVMYSPIQIYITMTNDVIIIDRLLHFVLDTLFSFTQNSI
ncbi:hypothetical protein CHUAL_007562 [Chamberlinius hualienensis]